jgi:hypothetical protein
MARKTEVYTWRVSSTMKATLEEKARNTHQSVAQLLDEIVANHLSTSDHESDSEIVRQRQLHARAARFVGCISSGVARRSERTRELVRARLNRRRAHAR